MNEQRLLLIAQENKFFYRGKAILALKTGGLRGRVLAEVAKNREWRGDDWRQPPAPHNF